MKRTFVIAAGALALGAIVYLGSRLGAQTATAPANNGAARSTRVAVINLSYVLRWYAKFKQMQEEMKTAAKPFEDAMAAKRKQLEDFAKEIENPMTTAARKEEVQKQARVLQREMEDIKANATADIGKKSDAQMQIVYREMYDAIQRYSQANGIDLVLQYNDVIDPKDVFHPAAIERKLRHPGGMPMYYNQGVDISYDVVMTLNKAYQGAGAPAGGNTTPPGGGN